MYRYAALAAGAFYVLFGVLGMIPPLHENWPADEPMMTLRNGRGFLLGVFPNNFALSMLHLAIGLWGVIAFKTFRTSWLFIRAAGSIFVVLAAFGLLPVVTSVAGVIPAFGAIALLHTATAALLAVVVVYGFVRGVPIQDDELEPALGTGAVSVASVAGVPAHVFLSSFPLAFLLGAIGTDLAHWWTTLDWYAEYNGFWATASVWLLGAGLASAIATALSGLVNVWSVREMRSWSLLALHVSGSLIATVLSAVNLAIRYADHDGRIIPWGILLSALTSGILVYCGWYAGYVIHRKVISFDSVNSDNPEVQ